MKSVISYTLDRCVRCLSCLRVCPTGAIIKQKDRVVIQHKNCINCGKCLNVCDTKGLQAKGSTLHDLENYDYAIALVPSNIYGMCKDLNEVSDLYAGLLAIGFDEVVDLSDIEGTLINKAALIATKSNEYRIYASCQSIRKWIELDYPMLRDKLLILEDASEIMAKRLRKQHHNKNLGIFLLCGCPSKLMDAKYPYGGKSNVDHALSVVDLFPKINAIKNKAHVDVKICKEGLYNSSSHLLKEYLVNSAMVIDGCENIAEVFELAEFNQLPDVKLLVPQFCNNGCIGGSLLWGNPYSSEMNIRNLVKYANKPCAKLDEDEYLKEYVITHKETLTMKERIERYNRLNEIIEQLPGFNCGACGYANCRKMAEEILAGNRSLKDCKIANFNKEDDYES